MKLFAKVLSSLSVSNFTFFIFSVITALFVGLIAIDVITARSTLSLFSALLVSGFFLVSLLEILGFSAYSAVQSAYVSVALSRMIEIFVLLEIS